MGAKKVIIDIEAQFHNKTGAGIKQLKKDLDDMEKSADDAKKALSDIGKGGSVKGTSSLSSGGKELKKSFDDAEKSIKKANNELKKFTVKKGPRLKIEADDSKLTKALSNAQNRANKLGKTRASVILSARDKASQILTKATSKAKTWGRSKYQAVLALKDQNATDVLNKVANKAKQIAGKTWKGVVKITDYATRPLQVIKNALFSLKTLAAAVFAGFATNKLIVEPVSLADTIENSRIAFETKLGSTEKANAFLQDIYKFDEKSPFDTIQIVGISQQMMNMGWEVDKVLNDLGTIGDWASSMGKGEEGISRVTNALGQMRQKGKLSSEEMLQLTEAGVSAWDYLAKSMGKTIPEVRELAEDGKIDVEDAISGILAGMKEFEGAAASSADRTVTGIIDQVKSLVQTYITLPWGEGLASGLKDGLAKVRDLLDRNKDKFKEWGEALKAVGTEASEWFAEKIQTIIDKVDAITATEEFKNADFGGKVKILWDGIVADPLAEWWDSSGREALTEKATDLGKAIGKGIFNGIVAFIKEHPIAATVLGLYGASKIAGGFAPLMGGITKVTGSAAAGKIGGSVIGNMIGTTAFGASGARMIASGPFAGKMIGAGLSSGLGLGAAAGGVVAGATLVSGAKDLYTGFTADNEYDKKYNIGSGASKIGGVATGAAIGTAILPGVGTLIGAGVGGVAGWLASGKIGEWFAGGKEGAEEYSKSSEKAAQKTAELKRKQQELAATSLEKHFGDIALSAEEVTKAVEKLIGNDKLKKFNEMSTVLSDVTTAYTQMDEAASALNKNMWFATMKRETKLSKDEQQTLKDSAKSYTDSSTTYLTESQYASEQAIVHLMGDEESSKGIVEKSKNFYSTTKEQLEKLAKEYNETLDNALDDGVISIDEEASLEEIRSKIISITEKLNREQQEGQTNLLKMKLSGEVDSDSFKSIIEQAQTENKTLQAQLENEFAQGSVGLEEGSKEWLDLTGGYLGSSGELHKTTGDLGLSKIKEKYSEELGILGQDLSSMLENNTVNQIVSKAYHLSDGTKAAIGEMVESMAPTTEAIEGIKSQYESLMTAYEKMGIEVPESVKTGYEKMVEYLDNQSFLEALSKGPASVQAWLDEHEDDYEFKPEVETDPKYNVKEGNKKVLEDKLKPKDVDSQVGVDLTPKERIKRTVKVQPKDFGTPKEVKDDVDVKLTGKKNILNKIALTAASFGVPSVITSTVTLAISAIKKMTNGDEKGSKKKKTKGFRGGLFEPERFATGGKVAGGARLITVAEEGTPEMIIPLGAHRRQRGIELWEETARHLRIPGFAEGGMVGSEPAPFIPAGSDDNNIPVSAGGSGTTVQVDIGGVTIQVNASGGQSVLESIRENKEEIAQEIADVFNTVLSNQFANTPLKA